MEHRRLVTLKGFGMITEYLVDISRLQATLNVPERDLETLKTGLPVVLQVLGPTASLAVAMVVIVENLLMLPLLLAAAETLGNRDATLWRALSRTLRYWSAERQAAYATAEIATRALTAK